MSSGFNSQSLNHNTEYKEKIHYLGDLRIVGQVVNTLQDKEPIGYVIMVEKTQKFKMYTVDQTIALLNKFKFVNAALESNKVVNIECSMSRMPKFNTHMQVVDNFGVIILGEIISNNNTIGYRAMDTNAKIVDLKENDILALASRGVSLINAKVTSRNNKQIVSAIKSEFTKIEKSKIKDLKLEVKSEKSEADKWREQRHIEKYKDYFSLALRYLYTGKGSAFNTYIYTRKSINKRTVSYVDLDLETKIMMKEVLTQDNGYNIPSDVRKLLNKIVNEVEHDKIIGKLENGQYVRGNYKNNQKYFLLIAQFALYNNEIRDNLLKSDYVLNSLNLDKVLKDIKNSPYIARISLETARELTKNRDDKRNKPRINARDKHPEREFKTKSFNKAEDIAQLGFAVTEQNRGYEYITNTGFKKKLMFIGDILTECNSVHNEYDLYKPLARCLGDLITIANMNRLMDRLLSHYDFGTNEYLPGKSVPYIEMLIIIAYLYESQAVRLFVENNKDTLNLLEVKVPEYDEIANTDYKLSKELKLYYESGYNVFYKDDNCYFYNYLDKATLINYRQLGPKHNIKHEKLQGELASIVTMLSSEDCSSEFIDENIGKLRFI